MGKMGMSDGIERCAARALAKRQSVSLSRPPGSTSQSTLTNSLEICTVDESRGLDILVVFSPRDAQVVYS